MNKAVRYVKALIKEFQNDSVPLLGAAQAYYYLLALIPLLILIISIVPYLNIDPQRAMELVNSAVPEEVANLFEDQIYDIVTEQRGGLLTIGILGTLWSASTGMNAFMKAQNRAYNVESDRPFLKARLVSMALTLGIIVALVIALVLPIFGDVIIDGINAVVPVPEQMEFLLHVLRWTISFVVIAAIMSALYHFAPNKKVPFKLAIPGAVFATLAWQVVSFGFSIYVSNFGNYNETYGSLGGIIVLMLWLFIIGIILVTGAEINAVLYRRKMGLPLSKVDEEVEGETVLEANDKKSDDNKQKKKQEAYGSNTTRENYRNRIKQQHNERRVSSRNQDRKLNVPGRNHDTSV
jgi:membrane protein